MGACWAHNPEVDGSKPSSAKLFFTFFLSQFFLLEPHLCQPSSATSVLALRNKIHVQCANLYTHIVVKYASVHSAVNTQVS